MPSPKDVYWNAESETMDPDEREQTVVLPKIRAQMAYAYKSLHSINGNGMKPGSNRKISGVSKISNPYPLSPRRIFAGIRWKTLLLEAMFA